MKTPGLRAKLRRGAAEIALIWASVTLPMALLSWVVAPLVIPRVGLEAGVVYWIMIIVGMAWQFVVAVAVLRSERRDWTWPLLKARLWLVTPSDPRTGRKNRWLYFWTLPAILFVVVTSDQLGFVIDAPMRWLFPGFCMPYYTDIQELVSARFEGQWWLLGLALTSNLFNYVLGEALLFHAVLLPRMSVVFGRWAWLVNAVVFGLYHVHLLGGLPSIIVSNIAYSLPAQRYRSVWLAVIIHGVEGVVVVWMTLWVILGGPRGPA